MYAPARRLPWIDRAARLGPGLVLLAAVTGLVLLGLMVLLSAGRAAGTEAGGYVRKQAVWLALSGPCLLVAWRADLEALRRYVPWIVGGCLVLLLAVLVPGIGHKVNGARRWIDLGPMNMQVSDFVKIGMIFTLSHYLATHQRKMDDFRIGFLQPGLIFGTVFLLVLLQPDYGTAMLCAVVGAALLFLAGARLRYLLPAVCAGALLFACAIALDPVRLRRILSFLDLEANKADGAYQLYQGILAFGAGGLTGVGLGNGRQQMAFLPEAHTDFIFPIIGEELGYFCTSGVVLAFLLIFGVTVAQLRRAPNLFQFLLATGALLLITLQALINFGVVTGLLPTKGMSLPFISYGGSNLLAMVVLVGLLLNLFGRWGRPPLPEREDFTP